jgi:membrane protease YdiL (CAAX protease family)
MSQSHPRGFRLRAYLQFLAAIVYFFVAQGLARRGAMGLVQEQWMPLASQAMVVFLLLVGYAAMGFWLDREQHPIAVQGLPRRPGWKSEAGLGLAIGWSLAVVCVLPMVLAGGIAIVLVLDPSAWGWLLADTAFFALTALAEEIAFRGYGFQRFAQAVGGVGAAIGFAAFYAILQGLTPGSSRVSMAVSIVFGLVLSTAYLRTKALWLSWGINFGWKASRALFFGLTISGVNSHSPVIQGNPMGAFWLTGGGFGLDGSWLAFVVLLIALPVVYRLTRDLDYRYNVPVFVPAGIPVDLDAVSRRQHEVAMGPAQPAAAPLVQILPVTQQPAAPNSENSPAEQTTERS